jgi:hypothetical protein
MARCPLPARRPAARPTARRQQSPCCCSAARQPCRHAGPCWQSARHFNRAAPAIEL